MITNAGDQPRFLFSEPGFEVLGFTGSEGLSELYAFEVELVTRSSTIAFDELVGKSAHLTILGQDRTARHVQGVIARLEVLATLPRRVVCRALLGPPHVNLTLCSRLRVFQDLSVREIVSQVLEGAGISGLEWKLKDPPRPRNYCVQYRETDLAFVNRLLEEEGIAFHFEHTETELKTVFTDDNSTLGSIQGKPELAFNTTTSMVHDQEYVDSFGFGQRMCSGKVELRDYNFKKPRAVVQGVAPGLDTSLEVYDYPGEFVDPDLGQRLAAVRLQQLQRDRRTGSGSSNCVRLVPGFRFTLGNAAGRHPFDQLNQEYLLVRVTHSGRQSAVLGDAGDQGATWYANTLDVLPVSTPFRPERAAPRPMALGVHTATVVGPGGEEIYVDQYGRVKLRFHWDREEKNTAWVRVAQEWAGAGYGSMFIPRVGQEVLVSFLEGDPDRPLVTGRIYNGEQRVPYPLPADKTRSTMKSASSPAQSGAFVDVTQGLSSALHVNAGFNELRFEDRQGAEEVFLHAQRDQTVVVRHDRTTLVKRDRIEKVQHDQRVTVGGNQATEVVMSSVHSADNLLIQAKEKLALKVGASAVVLTPTSISIGSPQILSSATATNDLRGGLVKVNCGSSQVQAGASAAAHLLGGVAPAALVSGGRARDVDPFATISDKGKKVLEKYEQQLEKSFQITAKDLANGKLSVEPSLTDAQKWVTGMMQELPLCDSGIGRGLGQLLGLSQQMMSLSPKELGGEVGERVTGWVEEQRDQHPALFWSAATAAAVGGGVLTYTQGTSVLQQVGIDPKISQSFFGDAVNLGGSVGFGPRLSDPIGTVKATEKVGDGLTLFQEVQAGGPDLGHVDIERFKLGADYTKDLGGGDRISAGLGYAQGLTKGSESLSGYLKGKSGSLTYGLDGALDPSSMDHKVEAYLGKQFSKNGSIEGFVREQSFGGVSEQAAGIMLKFSF